MDDDSRDHERGGLTSGSGSGSR